MNGFTVRAIWETCTHACTCEWVMPDYTRAPHLRVWRLPHPDPRCIIHGHPRTAPPARTRPRPRPARQQPDADVVPFSEARRTA